jgi:hypothetical protein
MDIHKAYLAAYSVCQRARDRNCQHIALQRKRGGGFRLAAVGASYTGITSARLGLGVTAWAENVLCRLADERLVDFDYDAIDAYLEELNQVKQFT